MVPLLQWYPGKGLAFLAVDQFAQDGLFRYLMEHVHVCRPADGIFLFLRSRFVFQQLVHQQLDPLPGGLLDLLQMPVQLAAQKQALVCAAPVLLQISPAHHPVFAQRRCRRLLYGQFGIR